MNLDYEDDKFVLSLMLVFILVGLVVMGLMM
jgi:hypothetical protein